MARKPLRQPSEKSILRTLEAWMLTETWDESRLVANERQRVLLSSAAERLLAQMLEQTQASASEFEEASEMLPMLTTHLQLLRRSREVGIDAAYDEFLAEIEEAQSETYDRLFKLLAGMTEEDNTALAELVDDPAALEERILEMLARQEDSGAPFQPDPEAVWQITALIRLLACEEPVDVFDLADEEPGLMDDEVISFYQMVGEMAAEGGDEEAVEFSERLNERLDLLREYALAFEVEDEDEDDDDDDDEERDNEIDLALLAFTGFLGQDTWAKSYAFLDGYPELLTPQVGELLATVVADVTDTADEEVVALMREHVELLRRCREVGRDAAFTELYARLGPGSRRSKLEGTAGRGSRKATNGGKSEKKKGKPS